MKGWRVFWWHAGLLLFAGLLGLNPISFALSSSSWYWSFIAAGGSLTAATLFWLCDYGSFLLYGLVLLGLAFLVFYAISAGIGGQPALYAVGAFLYGLVPISCPVLLAVSGRTSSSGKPIRSGLVAMPFTATTIFMMALLLLASSGVSDMNYTAYSCCAVVIAFLSLACLGLGFAPVGRAKLALHNRRSLFRSAPPSPALRVAQRPSSRAPLHGLPEDEPPGSFFRQPQFPVAFDLASCDKTTQTEAVYRAAYAGRTTSGTVFYRAVEEQQPVHFPSGMKVLSALESAAHLSAFARSSVRSASGLEVGEFHEGVDGTGSTGSLRDTCSPRASESLATSTFVPGSSQSFQERKSAYSHKSIAIPKVYHIPAALQTSSRPSPGSVLLENAKRFIHNGTNNPALALLLLAVSEFLFTFLALFCRVSLWQEAHDLHEALLYICPVGAAVCALALCGCVAAIPKLSVKAALGWAFALQASSGILLAGTGLGLAAVILAVAALACSGAGLSLALVSVSAMTCRRPGFDAAKSVGMLTSAYSLARVPALVLAPLALRVSRLTACLTILVTGGVAVLLALTRTRAITDYSSKRSCRACQAGYGQLGRVLL